MHCKVMMNEAEDELWISISVEPRHSVDGYIVL